MSEQASGLSEALRRAGTAMRLSAVLQGLARCLGVCGLLWLGVCLLDNWLHLPAALRLPAGLALVGFTFWDLYRRVLRPFFVRNTAARAAIRIERDFGVSENLLINAHQLSRMELNPREQRFAAATLARSRAALRAIAPERFWRPERIRRIALPALVLLLIWTGYVVIRPEHAANAFARLLLPLRDTPPVAAVRLVVHPGENVTVIEGDDLSIVLQAQHRGRAEHQLHPVIAWSEADAIPAALSEGVGVQRDAMVATAEVGLHTFTFRRVRRGFAFRVFCDDAHTRNVRVRVAPLPRLLRSEFVVAPPAYVGGESSLHPGPPAALNVLPGSLVSIAIWPDRCLLDARWEQGASSVALDAGAVMRGHQRVTAPGPYVLTARDPAIQRVVELAAGELVLAVDRPPTVRFETAEWNRYLRPGEALALQIVAADDYGLSNVAVEVASADRGLESGEGAAPAHQTVRNWLYLGPPGPREPAPETVTVPLDPAQYLPGHTYVFHAVARDFNPAGETARSRPIVVRIHGWDELAPPDDQTLAEAFRLLQQTVEAQRAARGVTANLRLYLVDAVEQGRLEAHRSTITRAQSEARSKGHAAHGAFARATGGARIAAALDPLVRWEMAWVLHAAARLQDASTDSAPPAATRAGLDAERMAELARDVSAAAGESSVQNSAGARLVMLDRMLDRQDYILKQLLALLGEVLSLNEDQVAREGAAPDAPEDPMLTLAQEARDLQEGLENFIRDQKRMLERSLSVLDRAGDDLTDEEEEIIGDLAREETEWRTFLEEKLTDFSKLPLQDFADGALAEELNEVYQDVKKAEASLYEKNVEIAVPAESSAVENAEELVHNLERWLPDTPDTQKWNMEEPPAQEDIALAELPAELEDIVGELLDDEEAMSEAVEDVSSSWLSSMDAGAGWDAMDGPISSMSAKGVSGNRLPNEMEVGGRAGEGRTGRSSGQMVENAAEGKDGRETPTRLNPTPFETGSVEDSSGKSEGGATGGGKLSGFDEAGLRGPNPVPPRLDTAARLAEQQAAIRQEAEKLALALRRYRLPTGELESSIAAMQSLEAAVRGGDGVGVRRAHSLALDALAQARKGIRTETGVRRERSRLKPDQRAAIAAGLREGTPRGYEDQVSAYFRRLAEAP